MKEKIFIACISMFMYAHVFAQTNTLDYFLSQATSNSPLLKDYQNQIQSNEYDSLLLRASYKPQVTGSSTNIYPPVINGYGYDQAITNGGTYNALIGVNKQLANKKNVAAQLQGLQLQNRDISNTAKISEQDLKKNIIAQYITAYSDQLQLNFVKDINALLSKEDTILKKLTVNNIYKQVDYLSFLVTLQQQQLQAQQLDIQFKNDYAVLNYLCGINNASTDSLKYPDINIQQLPDINASSFFQKFEIDSLKLVNSKALIDNNYRAKINLFADAGYNSSLAYKAYKNFGTSIGISAIIPIYDGKQRKLQYDKLTLAEKTRQHYRSFFSDQYHQQIEQLMQQFNSTNELFVTINNQLRYTKALIDANEKLLETGDVRITDYILSLNNYLNAKNLITQNIINRLQIINQLNYWNR